MVVLVLPQGAVPIFYVFSFETATVDVKSMVNQGSLLLLVRTCLHPIKYSGARLDVLKFGLSETLTYLFLGDKQAFGIETLRFVSTNGLSSLHTVFPVVCVRLMPL